MLQRSKVSCSLPSDYQRAVKPLPVVKAGHGLHLRALVDIEGESRRSGDEWMLQGPVTYVPNPDVVCVCVCVD